MRAITNLTRVSLIGEATAGTTPALPAMLVARATRENFAVNRMFTKSEEFNALAQVVDQLLVGNRAEGGFSFEWADGEAALEKMLESCLWGTWSTNVLLAGVTPVPLTIETKYEAGADDQYKIFTGMHGNELSLEFNTAEKITGSCSFIGMSSTFAAAGVTGATYTAAGTEPVNVTGDMTLSSADLAVSAVTKLTMRVNNSGRVHQCLGSFSPSAVARGTLELTGDIEFYLNTGVADWATAYLGNTVFELSATAGATTGKKTTFLIPTAKFKTLTLAAEGNDQDLMVRGTWEAFYDSSTGSALEVTRNVA
jgi:hypothetical protein